MPSTTVGSWSSSPQLPITSGIAPKPKPQGPAASESPWGGIRAPSEGLEPHFREPYEAYISSRSPEAASKLLTAVSPVIDKALKSYAGGESNTATLRARAKTMALEAVRRYDPNRAKLETHLLSHLRGLRRATERATSGVYVPESWRLDARKLDAGRVDLADELGREPSDVELADRLQLPIDRIAKARSVPGVLSGSQVGGDIGGTIKPDQKAWDTWLKIVHADLGDIDRVILERSFGMHGHPVVPAHEIAKMLNLSPAAVSLRKQRIQQHLDQFNRFMGVE